MSSRATIPVLVVVAIVAIGASLHYYDKVERLRDDAHRKTKDENTAPRPPSILHELVLGPHERLRMISLESAGVREWSDMCVLYTNDLSNSAVLHCRSPLGEWGR